MQKTTQELIQALINAELQQQQLSIQLSNPTTDSDESRRHWQSLLDRKNMFIEQAKVLRWALGFDIKLSA